MQSFLNGKVQLRPGDCLDVLRAMDDASIDACVTDPPYGLAFMGRKWDTSGPDQRAFAAEFWAEVLRVLKPGGWLIAASGTRTYHRLAVAVEDAGFEIRDMLSWLYGSGFPKSHNQPGGLGTALKPACEPWVLARKPLIGTVAQNVLQLGVGALNIGACRIGSRSEEWGHEGDPCCSCVEPAARSTKPATPATEASTATRSAAPTLSAGQRATPADTVRTDIGCCAGSKTANTATSLNTSASGEAPTVKSQQTTRFTTATDAAGTTGSKICNSCGKPITAATTSKNTSATKNGSPLGASAQGPTEPAGPLGRWPANVLHDGSDEVVAAFPEGHARGNIGASAGGGGMYGHGKTTNDFGAGDAGSAARFFYSAKADANDRLGSKHPTVKPVDLMQYLVRLVTPKGGVVLDPFAGTGTTGEAAFREGMRAILVEREPEYQADIARRMGLCLSGQDERKRALTTPEPVNALPLFGAL